MPKRRSSDSSRRNFLKAAGFVGAAAATVRPATAGAIGQSMSQLSLRTLTITGRHFLAAKHLHQGIAYLSQTIGVLNCASVYASICL